MNATRFNTLRHNRLARTADMLGVSWVPAAGQVTWWAVERDGLMFNYHRGREDFLAEAAMREDVTDWVSRLDRRRLYDDDEPGYHALDCGWNDALEEALGRPV